MNTIFRLINAFVIAILFVFACSFANIKKTKQETFFSNIRPLQEEILVIYKKNEKELDLYTFTPKIQADRDLITAVENRLKVINKGVVSFSANDKNLVTLIVNPAVITKEGLEHSLRIVTKIHEYYADQYKIIEL